MKEKTLIIVGFSAIGLTILAIAYLAKISKPSDQPEVSTNWANAYAKQQQDIYKWKQRYEFAHDSVISLQVQIGELGVELNRSEAKQTVYKKNYHAGKQVKDTSAMLSNCDSLIDELDHVYIENRIHRDELIDSLNNFYGELLGYKDSALVASDSSNSILVVELANKELALEKEKQKTAKAKKKSAFGWIAAGVASVFTILISITK